MEEEAAMDSKISIPGLGQLLTEKSSTTPPSDAALNDITAAEPTSETEMTSAMDAPSEVNTQPDDKVIGDTQEETVAAEAVATVIPEVCDTEMNGTVAAEAVATVIPEVYDTEMNGTVAAEAVATVIPEVCDTEMNGTVAAVAVATVIPEVYDTEMNGTEIEAQQVTAIESAPASPLVTHALEAALDGLLGPAEEPASNETLPSNGEHSDQVAVNSHESIVPTTSDQIMTSELVPTEGEALPVEGDADANPEWEADSSPYESSSSDSSDDSSDDDSDVEESKLGIEETARLLMEADGGSDEEIDGARAAKQAATVRTKNEQPDEPEPKPEITIDAEDKVLPLGIVQHIVEGTHVVIEALRVGGAPTILDRGTVLCKEDRTVLGVIHDTIATVHRPMYILKCRSEKEVATLEIKKGGEIWYAVGHAVVVFPSQLKALKGSDASNIYDEEIGLEEMEYSDDELEQAHKRAKKHKKQKAKGNRGNNFSRGDDNDSRASVNGDAALRYDDDDDDGPYKPLSRPVNFGMGLPPPPPPPVAVSQYPPAHGDRGGHQQGRRGDSRSRGSRGRGGFNGRGRGGGGGYGQRSPLPTPPASNNYLPPPPYAANTPPMPGHWPFPVPPIPHFGGAAPSNPNTPSPSYPMPNWGAGQASPFPFVPVPPPNWPNAAQRAPQQMNYSPPTRGYNMPAVQYPPNGATNSPVPVPPPPPPPNYQQQYQQNYYGNGQSQNGQTQQRWDSNGQSQNGQSQQRWDGNGQSQNGQSQQRWG